MTDDKANEPQDDGHDKTVEIGIQTDPVPMMVCPGCGVEIDTEEIPSFTEIACPHCKTRQTVPAKLANFKLLSVIGAGGMGAVFLAEDATLNRRVAIKVMLSTIGSDPTVLETFRREAQSAARLNHPHIVQIYSFGEEKGQPYLVMELVSGDKLDDLIEAGEPLDPAFVIRVGAEIAEGLATAQAANLVHGDIKPENILFDEKMHAKLVDFGIASMLSSKDSGNEVWGTPFYIAPEKAQRKKTDVRSDIYSLGATLYHAIAGRPPFDGEDAVAVIRARFDGPAKSLAEIRPGIEPQAVAIIERMMQNDLFLRYPNYTSLIKDMRKYLESVPEARKAGTQSRKLRMRKSNGQGGNAVSSGSMVDSAHMPKASGGHSGGFKTGGTTPPPPASGGRKAFVIQKGTISAASLAPSPVAPPIASAQAPSTADTIQSSQPLMAPPERRRGISPKTIAILVISLFGAGILIVVAVLVGILVNSQKKEKAMDLKYTQAQAYESEWDALQPSLAEEVAGLAKRDAESQKVLKTASDLVAKALSVPLVIPDLEPPKPVAPPPEPEPVPEAPAPDSPAPDSPAPEASVPAATVPETGTGKAEAATPPAEGVAVAEPPVAETAAPASEPEAAPTPDPVAVPEPEPEAPKPVLVAKAEALFAPARQIRARLREAETMRDREYPPLGTLKRETMSDDLWTSRKARLEARQREIESIRAMGPECDALLLTMRRMLPDMEKEATAILDAARQREEAARLAREAEEAEAARQREQAAREAKAREDLAYVESMVQQRRPLIDKFQYERVSKELGRLKGSLATEGGNAAVEAEVERYARLASLKEFIVRDLHENQGLRWGWGQLDIVDADAESITVMGGRKVPLETVTITQWIALINKLLEARPPERAIRMIEHGEQLFNAAIFCTVHGSGSEAATAKALTLVKLALQRRTALRPQVARLIPPLANADVDAAP